MKIAVYAKHPPYTNGHLGKVAADMDVAGAPTIRVMEYAGFLFALEGSHRLAIAHQRGMEPKLVVEIADSQSVPDSVLLKVKETLPLYVFNGAHVLRLDGFK